MVFNHIEWSVQQVGLEKEEIISFTFSSPNLIFDV